MGESGDRRSVLPVLATNEKFSLSKAIPGESASLANDCLHPCTAVGDIALLPAVSRLAPLDTSEFYGWDENMGEPTVL